MRGILSWRAGDWDEARSATTRAPTSWASRSGRSEVAFSALFWLAAALRDSGDLGGRRDRARPGARHLRAGRPDRPVGRGDLGPRRRPRARRPRRAGAGRRRGGRAARRAAALPGRPGRQGRGRRGRAEDAEDCAAADRGGPRPLARARAPARRGALPDGARPAACSSPTPRPPTSCSTRPPRSTRSSGRPALAGAGARAGAGPDGLLEAAGADRGARRRGLGPPLRSGARPRVGPRT